MNIYYVAGVPYTSELYHHGILGQKWGVRRFQNKDGSYTEAGKNRYYKNTDPETVASWVHEVSASARVNSASKKKLFDNIQDSLDIAKESCREQARVESKAWLDYNEAGEKVIDEWYNNRKLRKRYADSISKDEIADIEVEAGDKFTDIDGRTTADKFVLDYALSKFKQSDHPLVTKEEQLRSQWKDEREKLLKQCKDYADNFFDEYGEDSAVANGGTIKTVSDVFAEYMETQLLSEEIEKMWSLYYSK